MQFFNSFGVIVHDGFYLNQYSKNIISFEDVKKVKMIKTRTYNLNILFVAMAFSVIAVTSIFNNQKEALVFCGYILSLLFFCLGFFYKKFKYQFIILNRNSNSFIVNVDDQFKNEAKKILFKINKKIEDLEKLKNLEEMKSVRNTNVITRLKSEKELVLN